jgi:hypothetical protein
VLKLVDVFEKFDEAAFNFDVAATVIITKIAIRTHKGSIEGSTAFDRHPISSARVMRCDFFPVPKYYGIGEFTNSI